MYSALYSTVACHVSLLALFKYYIFVGYLYDFIRCLLIHRFTFSYFCVQEKEQKKMMNDKKYVVCYCLVRIDNQIDDKLK